MTTISQTLLTPSDYQVSRVKERKRVSDLETFKKNLEEVAPDFVDAIVDGYTIIGKTNKFQQYLAQKEDSDTIFAINLSRIKGAKAPAPKKDLSQMNITTKKLRDVHYDENDFIPMKSDTAIDFCFSSEGGIFPATNYIVIGDPGIGKSSVTIEHAARVQAVNPTKKVLFLSGEMTEMDLIPYTKRFPLWLDVEILFISDLTEGLYKESIEEKLKEGYDMVLGDSFAEIADAVRGDYNETVKGSERKSYNDIEKWLVDLMVFHNKGNNESKTKTAFVFIQQMTKGGDFVGSNKLKHNTTGMLELRYTKSGDRQIVVSKNRRGFEYNNLHFDFTPDVDNPISYDVDRILRDKSIEAEIKAAAEAQRESERDTDSWLEKLGADINEEVYED